MAPTSHCDVCPYHADTRADVDALMEERLAAVRNDVEVRAELKAIREAIAAINVRLDSVTNRGEQVFHRYVWPILQLVIAIVIAMVASGVMQRDIRGPGVPSIPAAPAQTR